MGAILRKDLKVLFASPLAASTAALFLFLSAFAFNSQLTALAPGQLPEASMRGLIYFMALVLLFITPLLTMRSFAEESRLKTMEALRTAPLSDLELVLAKFGAIWIYLSLLIIATGIYPLIMWLYAAPDLGPILSAYLGLFLLCGAYAGVGVLASSLVTTPMLASLLAFVALLMLWFFSGMEVRWLEDLSIISHLETFSIGVLAVTDLAYYILLIITCLFLTWRWQEASRWK